MKGEKVLYISLVSYIVDSMHLASILKKKGLFIYIHQKAIVGFNLEKWRMS